MREYLFELRKKANLSQAEIDVLLHDKYNLKLRYSQIELGTVWKDLSGSRAPILAEILGTTPEYLLRCEAKEGGYVGKNFRMGHGVSHMVRNGQRLEYDEPLTDDEKELAGKYIPYTEKIIDILMHNEYRNILGNIMSCEDFYDIGMIAFLRAVKSLMVKKEEDKEFMETLEEPDYFYRYHFSKAIKGAYSKYIRAELTLTRKKYHSAFSLDMPIGENGESDTEQYNFVSSKDLPIPITAESTWTLDTLYKYLSNKQICACRMLIAGWTVPEIVKGKYASKRDIGIIRFYLLQFKQYGSILWKEESYKSDAMNVSYHFETNKWKVHLMYEHTAYSLGSYKDLNIALDVQSAAHFHLAKGDFLQWYKANQAPNVYTNVAFTYLLPGDEKELAKITQSSFQKTIEKRRGGLEISLASKENPVGVVFNRRRGTYDPSISGHKLGTYKNFEDALAIRQQAEAHVQAGDFDSWFADFKEKGKRTRYLMRE